MFKILVVCHRQYTLTFKVWSFASVVSPLRGLDGCIFFKITIVSPLRGFLTRCFCPRKFRQAILHLNFVHGISGKQSDNSFLATEFLANNFTPRFWTRSYAASYFCVGKLLAMLRQDFLDVDFGLTVMRQAFFDPESFSQCYSKVSYILILVSQLCGKLFSILILTLKM